jgi:hypothetical protein
MPFNDIKVKYQRQCISCGNAGQRSPAWPFLDVTLFSQKGQQKSGISPNFPQKKLSEKLDDQPKPCTDC